MPKILIAVFAFFVAFFPACVIEIQADGFHCTLHTSQFRLKWKHSVEHQFWLEDYRVQQGKLQLYQTFFETFGAGTPSSAKPLANAPLGYVGYEQNVMLDELRWTVSPRMEGVVQSEKGELPLYHLVPAYTVVNIKPVSKPFLFAFLGESCNE